MLSRSDADDDSQEEEEPQELCLQKTSRPLKLGDELDKQVKEYVKNLQSKVINTAVVIAMVQPGMSFQKVKFLGLRLLDNSIFAHVLKTANERQVNSTKS